MRKKIIKLGSFVECIHSGFKGVAVARTVFINGCVQYEVQPRVDDKGAMPDSVGIDVDSLKVIKSNPLKKKVSKPTGGPNTKIVRRNY